MNCDTFKTWLYHFQQDELDDGRRDAFLEHMEACAPCARRFEFEDGMRIALRTRLAPAPPPPGLETRIRASLETRAARPRFAWFRRPAFAAVVASLLLAVLVVPTVRGSGWFGMAGVRAVDAVVTVIDPDCAAKGRSLADQRRCRHAHHLNALRTDDGEAWHVSLDDERFRALLTDPEMRGRRLRVRGNLYGAIRTVKLSEVETLAEPSTHL